MLPFAVRTLEAALVGVPVIGGLAYPIVGITAQHYRSVWIEHAFYRQFLNSMIVTGGWWSCR
jgi:multiple sugar transport system permease protein